MILLYIASFFRTILIVVGVYVIVRFVGKIMVAKRNLEAQEKLKRDQKANREERLNAQKKYGQTTISKTSGSKHNEGDFVDFEEIIED